MCETMNEELYWIAGFLEGEGSFVLTGRKSYTVAYPRICAGQNTREPLDRVARFLGGNVRPIRPKKTGCKEFWSWTLDGAKVSETMRLLRPLLSSRRQAQIDVCIAGERRNPIGSGSANRNKTHCPRGHSYSIPRLRLGRIHRECRECRNLSRRIRYRNDPSYREAAIVAARKQRERNGRVFDS